MNLINLTNNMIPEKKVPKIKTGDIVRVTQELAKEEGVQHQVFEGLVISVKGSGFNKTFTVRKIAAGVGVEKVFPIYSPTISKIEIKKSSKVKRAKLYWLRDRVGKSAKLTEKDLDPEVIKMMEEADAGKIEEKPASKDSTKAEEKEATEGKKEGKDEKKAKAASDKKEDKEKESKPKK